MIQDDIIYWFGNGEVGMSSTALALGLLCMEPKRPSHPLDPADLRRCVLLLDEVDNEREHLDNARELSPVWNDLIDRWTELETSLRREMDAGNRAPDTWALMREIIGDRTCP